jgi:hypothetical protein
LIPTVTKVTVIVFSIVIYIHPLCNMKSSDNKKVFIFHKPTSIYSNVTAK